MSYKIDSAELDNRADFEFKLLTSEDLEESLVVLNKSFFPFEAVLSTLKTTDNPAAVKEVERLCSKTAEDGISVIAKEKESGRIVSVAFNKLQVKPKPGEAAAFDEIAASFTQPESLAVMDFMITIDGKVNMFERYATDSLAELMFLGTLPEYCKRGLAKDVTRATIQVAAQTGASALTVLCTSPYSERIAVTSGFDLLYRGDGNNFVTPQGVKYSDVLGSEWNYTLRALPLKATVTKL